MPLKPPTPETSQPESKQGETLIASFSVPENLTELTEQELQELIEKGKQSLKARALEVKAELEEIEKKRGKNSTEYRTAFKASNTELGRGMGEVQKIAKQLRELLNPTPEPQPEPQPEPTPELPETLQETYEKAERLFKENFIGITQVETAFTIQDKNGNLVKLIELSPQEQQEATRLLKEKLEEPDIRVFLKKLESKELNPEDYLLVLRVPAITPPNPPLERGGTLGSPPLQGGARGGSAGTRTGGRIPLTMQSLNQRLQPDLTAKQQGKLLYDTDWYEQEQFYTAQQPGNTETEPDRIQQTNGTGKLHWQITTKALIPDSLNLNKTHAEQTPIIQQAATQASLDPAKTRCRTPVETTYDWLTTLRKDPNNQERILTNPNRYDWSDVRSSGGRLVGVGFGDFGGLVVGRWPPGSRGLCLGVSLSR